MAVKIPNRNILFAAGFLISFLLVNYNQTLGQIYLGFMFLYLFLTVTDNKIMYSLNKGQTTWGYSILLAIFIYVGFNIVSGLILATVSSASIVPNNMFQSVAKLMATATPVLAATGDRTVDLVLTILAWGLLVGFIETVVLFGGVLEWVEDAFSSFKTRFNFLDGKTWFVVALIAAIFTVFHIQAKGLKDSAALLVTFIFGVVSLWVIIKYKGETKTAVIFHILANTVAVLATAGLLG